jgi:hypothetical protein
MRPGLSVLRTLKAPRCQDVFVTGTHTGLTLAQHILPLTPRGVLANDAGRGMDDSGVAALPLLNAAGIAAAAVDAMSARVGNVMSTYHDGICSVVNNVARSQGITVGMPAKEAARLLLQAEQGRR